ncbi:probable leucine-rich repeat receptor-like protein kinase At1g35710 [Durio zibethinus]|uniref:Probable leucine-rich repeat receptor-like protein kinase At1g35710 n=1 Tax=Durio zibethinus TaxID=66656 RepID=A0A6P6BAA7_DURZI|nr:probable leucine-rich repeat receptor-like protein kinase At1g35710 [Durio zibethinus]
MAQPFHSRSINEFGGASSLPQHAFLFHLFPLSNLSHLTLDNNKINSSISPEVGNLKNIIFYFSIINNGGIGPIINKFDGRIPPVILEGPIPKETSNLEFLTWLSLSQIKLDGFIPPENRIALEIVDVSTNNLEGCIPPKIGMLFPLNTVDPSHNFISREIPSQLGDSMNPSIYDISYNNLSGPLPPSFKLQQFEYL